MTGERRLQSYDRKSVVAWFRDDFHEMLEREGLPTQYGDLLEKEELQKRLGKLYKVDELMAEGKLIVLWPGENKPVFPYFQLDKGRLRPEIEMVLQTIRNFSENTFYSPMQLCKWFFTKVDGSKDTPLTIMKNGYTKKLLKEAEKFGKNLLPRIPEV